MKSIYKSTVHIDNGSTEVMMPIGSRVVHVACQSGPDQVQLWYEVDLTQEITEFRTFVIHGTGHDVPMNEVYIGSALTDIGLVWHVYERDPR